ncbi:MAG: hypothetical protein LBT26_08920 [Clostridiales Family XIII bacterium]|jgi:hypothetical protein|nr:hypothetical protein [Clostridiales Family XIII bacterium]
MKNKRIVDSWDKIETDSAADERMLSAILARNHSGKYERNKVNTMNRTINWKRLAPIAACFVFVFALVGVFGNNAGWFGSKTYVANLSGGTLSFYNADMPGEGSFHFDFDVTSRDLTGDETKVLFGDLPATAYASFNAENHSFIRLEGKIGNTKIIIAAPDAPITDTIIESNENVSEVGGVPVTAGYFITKANSQGVKTIIYFASWNLGDVTEYVEFGGDETDNEALSSELASIIEQLIQNGEPNLSQITELERICAGVGNISVSGGSDLPSQLTGILRGA